MTVKEKRDIKRKLNAINYAKKTEIYTNIAVSSFNKIKNLID